MALTNREIAIASGIRLARVEQIAGQVTWAAVTLDECERFLAGCNFNPLDFRDRNRHLAYIRSCKTTKTKFRYLTTHPAWHTEMKPVRDRLRARLASSTPSPSQP